jgi:alanine racemase
MRAWLEVDLDVVAANYDIVKRHVGDLTGVFAVIKADAYGHGIEAVVRTLDPQGVHGYAVISLEEALRVRAISHRPVLILGYLDDEELATAIENGFSLNLYDLELARLVQATCDQLGAKARVHLKVETGLNRLGMAPEEALFFVANRDSFPSLEVEAIFTHLSTSSDRHEDLRQLAEFDRALGQMGALGFFAARHMANSHALAHFPEGFFDFVRVGLALYGVEEVLPGLQPSLQCKSVVIQRKHLRRGHSVSYNKLFTAPQDMEIAVIGIGYAEGLSQALTGKAQVLVGGQKKPIIGQICMNLCVVDVTGAEAARGDEVVVIGSQRDEQGGTQTLRVADLAKAAGLRHHEIITRLGKSLPKIYLHSPAQAARQAVGS